MSLEILEPVSKSLLEELSENNIQDNLFNKLKIHNQTSGVPNIEEFDICMLGVKENRNSFFSSNNQDLNNIRKELYNLKFNNWKLKICDLGDLPNGDSVNDTYHALTEICEDSIKKETILVIIGGTNDLIFPMFKSFTSTEGKVNIVSIDNQLDLYQDSDLISGRTYMNKIIVDESNKLNDFTNIGYQRHLCSPNEIQLMEKLFFEYISLGEIIENNMKAEPVMRNANIISFDMKSLSFSASFNQDQGNPNGIDSRLSCILAKYAGIGNKSNFFCLFELNDNIVSNKLYSEIIWYFIDGVDKRNTESNFNDPQTFNKYIVQTSGRDIIFFKSKVSERWWMLIEKINKKESSYLPCLETEYQLALNDEMPVRWLKAQKRI